MLLLLLLCCYYGCCCCTTCACLHSELSLLYSQMALSLYSQAANGVCHNSEAECVSLCQLARLQANQVRLKTALVL